MSNDWKANELFKMFSHRTYRKEKENYIVNAIWQRIDDFDIEPVTQQCVKFEDGKYALIDLYFPQVNIGVECDEKYHEKNKDRDKHREIKIEDVLSSIGIDSFRLFRIDAEKDLKEIHKKIDEVVKEVKKVVAKKKSSNQFEKWKSYDEKLEEAICCNRIQVSDMLSFHTIEEACRVFQITPPLRRCFFKINEEYQIWFPKLALKENDELKPQCKDGWINELSSDWSSIKESNTNGDMWKKSNNDLKDRIVFARGKDKYGNQAYRFIGVFRPNSNNHEKKIRIYKRINEKIDLETFK